MKKIPELFLTFAKIGLFTFGGGNVRRCAAFVCDHSVDFDVF